MENLKKQVGQKAAQLVSDGMTVGLGTGSTAAYFVDALAQRIREEHLSIIGVTTSSETRRQAEQLGIPLKELDQVDYLDVTVDGADEIDAALNGIKGGGGALLMEKIVANYSKHYVWIVDESKLSEQLGSFKLPVEVVQYGSYNLFHYFEQKGYQPTFRLRNDGERYITDMQNVIIDLHFEKIEDPQGLADELDKTVGVVEHGLFNQMVDTVIVGKSDGIHIIERKEK